MNVLIPDSWLRDFIKTKATPQEIAEKLSLTSFNIEKIHQTEDGDAIYEIEMTPNRGDALSVLGIAREVYASLKSFGVEAKLDEPDRGYPLQGVTPHGLLGLDVNLSPKVCPHFAALILDNVKIKPSPKIIQERLEKSGVRALNNVIDVTSYIMLELGQPMHAFDFDKLASAKGGLTINNQLSTISKKMILRESKVGETIVTLDGVKRGLPKDSIIIEDGEKIIDLCGIMGGENSAIDDKTRRVILFAQIYDPVHIRKTSVKLQLRTEAAQRFEKGLDCEMVLPALFKAAEMLKENAEAKIASELINIREKEFEPHIVSLTMKKLNNYLGIELKPKQVQDYLESLGFLSDTPSVILESRRRRNDRIQRKRGKIHSEVMSGLDSIASLQNDGILMFGVPSWRDSDIQIEEDLIEEVARLYGYHKIPSLLPAGRPPPAVQSQKFAIERRLKYLLKDLGFTEVYTYSMVKKPQTKGALKLRNPLTSDLAYMRLELIPSLIQVVEENRARFPQMKIFEMANGYFPTAEGALPKEKLFLACLMTATKESDQENFAVIKGLLETIFEESNVKDYIIKPSSTFPYGMDIYPFDPQNSAVVWPTKPIQSGKIITPVRRIKDDIWGFQIHVEALAELATEVKTYQPIPQFPAVKQDLAFVVNRNVLAGDILEAIRKAGGKLLADVEIFDVYQEPEAFGKDKKSIAVHLSFQHPHRSLSEQEATTAREKIEQILTKEFNARIRKQV